MTSTEVDEQEELDIDQLAEEVYNYLCANRGDNLKKDGSPGDPRKVGSDYDSLFDEAKTHYRNMAKWHLEKLVSYNQK